MILVVTLILSVVIALFLVAAVQLLPTMGLSSENLEERQLALLAAQSGVDYAQVRLQADPSWRGDGAGLLVDTPELKVVEDRGNVFGFLVAPDGSKSFFRLRFNFQNGSDTPDDGLDMPTHLINSPFVSYNNLRNGTGQRQYRAEPSGGGVWQVTDTSPFEREITKYTASIIVEGFAGRAVRSVSSTSPNLDPNQGAVSRQVVEAYFARAGFLTVDSAVMAAQSLDVDLLGGGQMEVRSEVDSTPPRVRALDSFQLYAASGTADYDTDTDGEVVVDTSSDFTLNGVSSTAPSATKESPSEQSRSWLKLGFDQVTRATSSDARVRAGTYVWKTSAGLPRLEYFPQEYTGTVPTGSGTVITSGDDMLLSGSNAVDLTSSNFRLRVKDHLYVEPQGGVTGFAVVSEPGLLTSTLRRPEVLLNHSGDQGVVLSNDFGNVHFEGKIDGGGSVTAEGDITFQGTSSLEADPNMAVALYAKGDINLEAIPNEVLASIVGPIVTAGGKGKGGKGRGRGGGGGGAGGGGGGPSGLAGNPFADAQDVAFGGIIYTQGDFNVDLRSINADGTPNATGTPGRIFVKGMLASYGGDPATQNQPGLSGSKGQVSMKVREAEFIYDPDYLDAIQLLDAPVRLDKTFWTTL